MTTPQQYLAKVLELQKLDDEGPELKALREQRAAVEAILRDAFKDSDPVFRYGGSKAKGTMLKESYDLDVICYFCCDDSEPGDSLKAIYESVQKALAAKYVIERKRCALRLLATGSKERTHIDVVPGRFVDDSKSVAYLHITTGDKRWLKTNLQKHIDHVRGSGRIAEIRLAKLWRVRYGLRFTLPVFVLELLVIDVLASSKATDLPTAFREFLEHLRDHADDLSVEDPANSGNDLSDVLNIGVKTTLREAARTTLSTIDNAGWSGVFGSVEEPTEADRVDAVARAVAATAAPTKPWSSAGE